VDRARVVETKKKKMMMLFSAMPYMLMTHLAFHHR
jgi:hypothetical protein